MAQEKIEFRNATEGTIGVVTIGPNGREMAIPLVPGATVWLTEEEQIATANAPARDEDNPFISGALEAVGKPENVKNRRPIGAPTESAAEDEQRKKAEEARKARETEEKKAAEAEEKRLREGQKAAQRGGARPATKRQSQEETGAPPQPQGKAAEGSRAAGEEVGTPEAAAAS